MWRNFLPKLGKNEKIAIFGFIKAQKSTDFLIHFQHLDKCFKNKRLIIFFKLGWAQKMIRKTKMPESR